MVSLHTQNVMGINKKIKVNWLNLIYVLFWFGISFASFLIGLPDVHQISSDLLKYIFSPLFLWIIAFFGDYLYTVFSLNKQTQIFNEKWIKISYVLVEILFILLFCCIKLGDCGRIICVVLLYLCMMGLKTSSLYVLCPRQRIQST